MRIKIPNAQAQTILDGLRSGDSAAVSYIADLLQKAVDKDNQLALKDDNRTNIEEEHLESFLTYLAHLPQDKPFAKSGVAKLGPVARWWRQHTGLTVEIYGASYSYYQYCYISPCWVQAITRRSDEVNNFIINPLTPRQIFEEVLPKIKWSTEHEAIIQQCLSKKEDKL